MVTLSLCDWKDHNRGARRLIPCELEASHPDFCLVIYSDPDYVYRRCLTMGAARPDLAMMETKE